MADSDEEQFEEEAESDTEKEFGGQGFEEHLRDVVSQVTVKALREFSTGDMQTAPGTSDRPGSQSGSKDNIRSRPTTGSKERIPSKHGSQTGSKEPSRRGSQTGSKEPSRPGSQTGSKEPSRPGSQAGSKTPGRPASQTGSREQIPSRPSSQSGSKHQIPSRPTSQTGSKEPSRPASQTGSKEGITRQSSKSSTRPGSKNLVLGSAQDLEHKEDVSLTDEVNAFPAEDTQDVLRCDIEEDGLEIGNEEEREGEVLEASDEEDDEEGGGMFDEESNELVVLDPDHPLMKRFQNALKTLLEKQLERLKLDMKETLTSVHKKQKEREDVGVELYGVQYELAHYQKTLENLQDELSKAKQCREQTEQQLADIRNLYHDKQQLTNAERKKGAELRAELENVNLRLFYLENAKEDVRSDIAVMKRAAEKAESEVIKAEESKQKQDLYVNRLVERLDQLREDIALYDVQLEAQMAETKAAREALTEARMEIDSITVEKKQLYAAWNSALVGMRRRDEAHAAMADALHEQQQRLLTIETEIDGFRRLIQKEQQENEKLTLTLNKMEGEIANVKRLLANCQAKFEAMKEEYAKYTRILHETEESLNRVNVEKTQCTAQLNEIRKAIEQQYREKVRLEDEILDKLRDQLTADKAAKYTQKIVHQLRERTKDLEQQIANAENDIAKTMLESTKVHTEIDLLEKRKTELEAEMKAKDDIVAKSQTEITRRNIEIKRKQDQLQQLNAEFDKLVLAAGGAELGPLEIQINSLHKSIEAENIAISELQQSWLRDQSELVRLSLEHDKQSSDVELMVKQHTILSQKKLRIEGEISLQLAEATGIEKEIHHLHIDMAKLDTLLHRERGAEDNLQQDNLLLESQFMTALKAAERESIQLQDRLESIKEEKERLLNSLVEAERQIMLWEKKTQLAKETRAAVDSDIGQGEIAAMRGEIHRMEVRYSQLMKQQEKMIQEMEKSVSRRETIAIRGEAQSKNSNKKIVTKNVLHRELAELKRKLKQTQQEANECETEIQRLKHQQQEFSLQLDDRQVKVQQLQTASDCYDADIDRLSEQKQVNIADLLARQQKTKYYQKLKDGKYTRLCRSSASLDQEKCRQHDQMNEILAIVDRLCNEYPHAQPALRKVIVNYGSRVSGLSTDHL